MLLFVVTLMVLFVPGPLNERIIQAMTIIYLFFHQADYIKLTKFVWLSQIFLKAYFFRHLIVSR